MFIQNLQLRSIMQHKSDIQYIFKTNNNPSIQQIQQFVVKNKIVFITKNGVEKLIKNNKSKISKKSQQPTNTITTQNQPTVQNEDIQEIFCCVCNQQFNTNQVFTIQKFQQQFFDYILTLQDYSQTNIVLKCSQCVQEVVCLLCFIKQYFITNSQVCPICKIPRSLEINNSEQQIEIQLKCQKLLQTIKIMILNFKKETAIIIQINEEDMSFCLEIHNTNFRNRQISYYNSTQQESNVLNLSPYHIYNVMNEVQRQDKLLDLKCLYYNEKIISFIKDNNDYQLVGNDKIRCISERQYQIETYNKLDLVKIQKLDYKKKRIIYEFDLPTLEEIDQLVLDNEQSKLAPKSFSMYQMKNRISIYKGEYKSSDVIGNQKMIIFIQSFSCYCGVGIEPFVFKIYNKEQKQFTLKDVMYNLYKQGFEGQCNHNFYEGFSKINDFTFQMNFGS